MNIPHRIACLGMALAVMLTLGATHFASAEPSTQPAPTKEGLEFFEKNIRPVLAESCYGCHSSKSRKVASGLKLDSWEGMVKGGESGKPAIVPGKPDESLLIIAIRYTDKDTADHDGLRMPPKRHRG